MMRMMTVCIPLFEGDGRQKGQLELSVAFTPVSERRPSAGGRAEVPFCQVLGFARWCLFARCSDLQIFLVPRSMCLVYLYVRGRRS